MKTAKQIEDEAVEELLLKMDCICEENPELYTGPDIGCPKHGIDSLKTERIFRIKLREAMKQAVSEVRPIYGFPVLEEYVEMIEKAKNYDDMFENGFNHFNKSSESFAKQFFEE